MLRVEKQNNALPIKLWCEPEEEALKQAYNLSKLPFAIKHIALMPDCLADNTEILTTNGFINITKLTKNMLIANYDINSGKVFFKQPINIINRLKHKNEKIYSFTNCIMDKQIIVSENHKMPYVNKMGCKAKDIPVSTEIKDFIWNGKGNKQPDFNIKDEMLCLFAWVVGDGNIKLSNKRKDGNFSSMNIRFGLTKQRKINRIISLLKALNIKYSYKKTKKQTTISIMVSESKKIIEKLGKHKTYPYYLIENLSTRQALLFLEECIKVDGDWTAYQNYGNVRYNSSRQSDIDFLSALIAIHFGIASNNARYTEGYKKIKMNYLDAIPNKTLIESNNGIHKGVIRKNIVKYNGNLVCVTCNSGYFIARQNGITFVSGNSHTGYGMPIGGILATNRVVIPNAVGKDIGCGICAVKTSLNTSDINTNLLKRIMSEIRKVIPVGFEWHSEKQDFELMPSDGQFQPTRTDVVPRFIDNYNIIPQQFENAQKQLGTLGGGNHFIEIQKDEENNIWIMIHSGSRNLGSKVADYYNKLAVDLNQKWFSSIPKEWELAFLPIETIEAKAYLLEMNYCVEFALANRKLMMERIMTIFKEEFGDACHFLHDKENNRTINIAHNYARWENHFGQNVIVHRKGATSAKKGEIGIIAGSQGTKSYIVEGKGNPESFSSCSHGAGRVMSRSKARKTLNLETEKKKLDDKDIVHSIRTAKDLDEASGAYKDIEEVMENQKDLVEIVHRLTPLAVIKG